jgi:hypothetical protein
LKEKHTAPVVCKQPNRFVISGKLLTTVEMIEEGNKKKTEIENKKQKKLIASKEEKMTKEEKQQIIELLKDEGEEIAEEALDINIAELRKTRKRNKIAKKKKKNENDSGESESDIKLDERSKRKRKINQKYLDCEEDLKDQLLKIFKYDN